MRTMAISAPFARLSLFLGGGGVPRKRRDSVLVSHGSPTLDSMRSALGRGLSNRSASSPPPPQIKKPFKQCISDQELTRPDQAVKRNITPHLKHPQPLEGHEWDKIQHPREMPSIFSHYFASDRFQIFTNSNASWQTVAGKTKQNKCKVSMRVWSWLNSPVLRVSKLVLIIFWPALGCLYDMMDFGATENSSPCDNSTNKLSGFVFFTVIPIASTKF